MFSSLLFCLQVFDNVEDATGDNTGDNTGVARLWVSRIGAPSSAGDGDFMEAARRKRIKPLVSYVETLRPPK